MPLPPSRRSRAASCSCNDGAYPSKYYVLASCHSFILNVSPEVLRPGVEFTSKHHAARAQHLLLSLGFAASITCATPVDLANCHFMANWPVSWRSAIGTF